MNLEIKTPDPLNILNSTRLVLNHAQFVQLTEKGLKEIARQVQQRIEHGLETAEQGFGATGNYVHDVQLIFLQAVTNFCFWSEKDQPRWQVEWPKGKKVSGFYALVASFNRALAESPDIFEANALTDLSRNQVAQLFRSSNQIEIPLLDQRTENLKAAGQVLKQKYGGQFINALESAQFDAIEIARLLYQQFISFQDVTQLDGTSIYFLKRAQICPNDLAYLSQVGGKQIANVEALTAFADYKLPQVLRQAGVISYANELASRIDNYVLIPAGSREESEIRAATIWGVELIRQKIPQYTTGQIDNALWLLSQDQTGLKPFHRTYTIFY